MALVRERSRQRAEQVLGREYDELRPGTMTALRSRLAARGLRFDDTDLDAFYNQAWHGLYLRLVEGESIDNRGGFLVHAAYCRAIEELRRLHPERRADAVDLAAIGTEPDLESQLDDHVQLTQFMEGMRERLTERERQAATLCYIHGCTRPQTAEALGVSPKRMEKLMDGVSRKIGVLVADIRDGSWCESRDSLMKACAFGVLDSEGERWQLASEHLRECPGCRRYVRGLRGIAAVAPPVGLPLAVLAWVGGGGGAAAGGAGSAGSAAGAGSSGAAGSAGGAGTASGAGGGIGTAGAAVAATVVVAAAGFGAFALVSRDDKRAVQPRAPSEKGAPPKISNPAAPPTRKPKPSPSRSRTTDKASDQPAKATGLTPAVAPALSTEPAPSSAAPEPADAPTTDAAQEFGFER